VWRVVGGDGAVGEHALSDIEAFHFLERTRLLREPTLERNLDVVRCIHSLAHPPGCTEVH